MLGFPISTLPLTSIQGECFQKQAIARDVFCKPGFCEADELMGIR